MCNHFEGVLQHIMKNRSWSDAEEALALERINHYRCDIDFASPNIKAQIYDLMEEYKEENSLSEGVFDNTSEHEVFMNL